MRIRFEVLDVEYPIGDVDAALLHLVDASGTEASIVVYPEPNERLPEPGDHVEQLLSLIVADHNQHAQDVGRVPHHLQSGAQPAEDDGDGITGVAV